MNIALQPLKNIFETGSGRQTTSCIIIDGFVFTIYETFPSGIAVENNRDV